MMLVCLPVYRRAALCPVWWHWAQSAGTLRGKVGDAESVLPRVWCGLWQSWQVGASELPCAESVPWVLSRYWLTWASWQMEQSTFAGRVSQDRLCPGVPPVWHCTQAMGVPPRLGGLWWMEVSSSALSTNSETVFPPRFTLRLGLAWQLWQSLSAMPSV